MNIDLTREPEDSVRDVNAEPKTKAGIGPTTPGESLIPRSSAEYKRHKARELIDELKTGLSPVLKTDLNARRLIQVCTILENILDGTE